MRGDRSYATGKQNRGEFASLGFCGFAAIFAFEEIKKETFGKNYTLRKHHSASLAIGKIGRCVSNCITEMRRCTTSYHLGCM